MYPEGMAVTIKSRSGSRCTFDVRYWNPGKTEPIDTEGRTVRLQLRSLLRPSRVLLTTNEYTGGMPVPSGTVLWQVETGHWRVLFSGAMTLSFPSKVSLEVEAVSDTDPDDVEFLFAGVILNDPQVVANA